VAFQNPSDDQSIGRSVYLRTVLLIIGWAIAGFLLYALSTFLPAAVMGSRRDDSPKMCSRNLPFGTPAETSVCPEDVA
jgi:hypothetical protein